MPSLLCHTLDAAMTASLRPRRRLGDQVRCVLSPRSTGYERVAAVVNAVDSVIPGAARRATAIICRDLNLPFSAERVEMLAFGSGATVFLARCNGAAKVVKVYRRTIGARRDHMPGLLQRYRDQYEEVRGIYSGAPGVVWPADFMVIGGPILDRPAVACVQEYIDGGLRDFFGDFSQEQALATIEGSDELRRQFQAFAGPTLRLYQEHARCPDFLGHHNLAVAGEGRQSRLRLIDYRLFEVPAGGRSRALRERLDRCIQRIESLAEALA